MALSFVAGQYLPAPGSCVSCHAIGKDSIDSGRTDDFVGALLICVDCYKWGVTEFFSREFVAKSALDDAYTYVEKLENKAIDLENKIKEKLRDDINGILATDTEPTSGSGLGLFDFLGAQKSEEKGTVSS